MSNSKQQYQDLMVKLSEQLQRDQSDVQSVADLRDAVIQIVEKFGVTKQWPSEELLP